MKNSFCELLQEYYPKPSEAEDFHSTFIANCVFNNFLSYTAIMLNVLTIHAIRKTSSLSKTLKTLLLSLAVSDVGVGLLVQPFYTSLLVKWLQQDNAGRNTAKAFYIIAHLFFNSSFSNVVVVSVDRFLAIHLHLRYQELVTHKRVVAVVILIWVFSVFVSLLVICVPLDIYSFLMSVIGILGLIVTAMIYIRIYLAVRRHKIQIQVQQVQQVKQTGEIAKFSSNIRSSVGIFYVYLLFLVCYLPYLFSLVAPQINGPSIVLKRFSLFSLTLICLNSSLNPLIYCWKMRHIRHVVINMLRNMSLFRSRASTWTLELNGHPLPWFSVIVAVKHILYMTTTVDSFNSGRRRLYLN